MPTFNWEPDPESKVVGFQREYVWPRPKADRFVESLLLGLPVPGIFPSLRFLFRIASVGSVLKAIWRGDLCIRV